MPIKLNGATNGSVELDVPAAVGSDLQVTLPATAGEVVVKDGSGNITTTGSATFGGKLVVSNNENDYVGRFTNSGTQAYGLNISLPNSTSNLSTILKGKVGGSDKVVILADGSATFNSFIAVNRTGSTEACFHSRLNGSNTSVIRANGSADFAKLDAVFNSSSDVGLNLRNSNAGTSARFYSGSSIVGSITVTGSATAFNTSSDYRLKENVVDIADGITRVKQLQPKRFNFIVDDTTTVDGFLAHEAQTVVPEAVTGQKDATREEEYVVTPAVEEVVDEDGNVTTAAADAVMGTRTVPDHQGIDQSKLVPLLTAALQEAIAKIETLETKVAALEAAS